MPKLVVTGSGTALEGEYRSVCAALDRIGGVVPNFDAGAYEPETLAKLREQWRSRMAFEHRSSAVFSQLAAQLIEANASLDSKVVMLRMAQDELRHTETCANVVRAFGGEAEAETDLTVEPLAAHRGVSPEERALRNVIFTTSCSEMVACARFVATLDYTTDPFVRDAMRRLLADEVLHGQFGFHYLEAWKPWLAEHPEIITSLERYLRFAFVSLEQNLAPRGARFPALTDAERALGADDPALAREVFYATVEGAVVPGLERFGIEAGRAWRDRTTTITT